MLAYVNIYINTTTVGPQLLRALNRETVMSPSGDGRGDSSISESCLDDRS